MKRIICLLCLAVLSAMPLLAQEMQTPFEQKGSNYSATHDEAIAFYQQLAAESKMVEVVEYKNGTDVGRPLHLVVISGDGKTFDPVITRRQDKRIVLINNGIHPGEPCGVDASMILARDLVSDRIYKPLLDHVTVLIIPLYNVGGSLNRGPASRANQNGPENYGFRGNGRLLDLNRDFIKADSRNARTFLQIFSKWKPDLFVDTHTTNGADYPAFMTYIPTQRDKLEAGLAGYMDNYMNPGLMTAMEKANYDMCTYVNTLGWGNPPDSGLVGFLETPRYSTGLATLYNTIGYTTEAHMLKTFEDRVYGTYHFLLNLLILTNRDRTKISRIRAEAIKQVKSQSEFVVRWELDPTVKEDLDFMGYEATKVTSEVTGMPRLSYNREKPWRKSIPFYNKYRPAVTVKKPEFYIVPQSWAGVIERLELAGVKMDQLAEDTEVEAEMYFIEDWEPARQPYEGHWPLANVKVRPENQSVAFRKGDYVIAVNQDVNRYIVETLEPEAHDSYFHWNFFDEILQRKEYFSLYVFEKTAKNMLEADPELKKEFQEAVATDSTLMNNDWAQMDYLYRKSPHYEPTHLRYPVARVMNKARLPLAR